MIARLLIIYLAMHWFSGVMSTPLISVKQKELLDDIENSYRLPGDIEPLSYTITLQPYLLESDAKQRFTFDGEVYIKFRVKHNLQKILIHMKSLNVTKSELTRTIFIDSLPQSEKPNSKSDIVTYTLKNELRKDEIATLHFIYKGTLSDDMLGFYRSSYLDNNNVTKWLASTQFQTNYARRAFPCFDEPKYKAKFIITLKRHKSMKSASNTNIVKSILEPNGYYADTYEETPIMAPYIVVFIVSEFNERSDGVISVMARPDFYPQTEYGFRIGQPILSYLDNYLNQSYFMMGIDKMQMAAIPDFAAGAMENWGLVTYRERVLLYEEGSTTLESKQSIASTIAHEDAHMWFGNLVTCDWWSYTWLNEGFARYFQFFATAEVEKEFQLDRQFVVDQVFSVMEKDSTCDTNPLTDPNTNTHEDLNRMFNIISYNKGAAFIRMVKFAMGEFNFRSSLRVYLDKYKYQSTVPQNLFDTWKAFVPNRSKLYADDLFNSFTTQVGYPVITFNLISNQTMEISQKRFLLNPNDTCDPNLLYTVPITFTTNNERDFNKTDPILYITSNENITTHNFTTNTSWIVANIQSSGYYRVNYDTTTWRKIHRELLQEEWGGIHEQNRAQIIHDLLNLARASMINYDLVFDILGYLNNETAYVAWAAAFDGFKFLTIRLGIDTDNFGLYIRGLSAKAYDLLGFEQKITDTSLDIYNRANILSWSCKYGNVDCRNRAKEYFNKNLNVEPVPVNIRSVVYCTAMRYGTESDLDKLIKMYEFETAATEKTLILRTLGCVKNTSLVKRLFNFAMSNSVRSQDKLSIVGALISENNENVERIFDLISEDLDNFATVMGGYSVVATVIENIASRFTEESQKSKLQEFKQNNEGKFGTSAEKLVLAEKVVANNLLWSSEKLNIIKKYLSETVNSSTGNSSTGNSSTGNSSTGTDTTTDSGSSIGSTLTLLSICLLLTLHILM